MVGDVPYIELEADRRTDRSNYHALGYYDLVVKNNTGTLIAKGSAVTLDYAETTEMKKAVKFPTAGGKIYGVALEDIAIGTNGWVSKQGKTTLVMLKTGTYVKGDLLKVDNQGLFEKTIIDSEAVGVCLVSTVLASNGLVKVKLF